MYLVKFRTVKCSLDAAKRGFYRAFNSIFGKIGHIAPEEVILQLVSTKCIPILLYGLEVLPIRQSQLTSLDFMINRLFMKLFKTNDIRLVHLCQFIFICQLCFYSNEQTRGQSNLTKNASRGAHSPVRGHPRGSKFVPLNSWGRVSY